MQKKHRITATVFDRRGKVLAFAENNYQKTHPLQKWYAAKCGDEHKIYLHAEIAALVKIRRGTPYRILVERYGANGQPLNATPCKICQLAIKEAGIEIIEHT